MITAFPAEGSRVASQGAGISYRHDSFSRFRARGRLARGEAPSLRPSRRESLAPQKPRAGKHLMRRVKMYRRAGASVKCSENSEGYPFAALLPPLSFLILMSLNCTVIGGPAWSWRA